MKVYVVIVNTSTTDELNHRSIGNIFLSSNKAEKYIETCKFDYKNRKAKGLTQTKKCTMCRNSHFLYKCEDFEDEHSVYCKNATYDFYEEEPHFDIEEYEIIE